MLPLYTFGGLYLLAKLLVSSSVGLTDSAEVRMGQGAEKDGESSREREGSAFTSFSETNCLGPPASSFSPRPSLPCRRRRRPLWIGGLIQMKLGPNPTFVRSSFAGSSFMPPSSLDLFRGLRRKEWHLVHISIGFPAFK